MVTRALAVLPAAMTMLFSVAPLGAQIGPVLHGRVEDASSRQPIAGARVLSVDSSVVVFTDSVGTFAIQLPAGGPLTLRVEQYGYLIEQFDLPDEAPSRISVLLLQPDPIELAGIEVEIMEETQVEAVLSSLRNRRNAYSGGVTAFDRRRLARLAPTGSAWDFVRQQVPYLLECHMAWSGVCLRLPGDVAPLPDEPEVVVQDLTPVAVCIDRWESTAAVTELQMLDIGSVALVEVFRRGLGGIRVYTPGYIASGRVSVLAPIDLARPGPGPTGGC
jgi:hypothetical protein